MLMLVLSFIPVMNNSSNSGVNITITVIRGIPVIKVIQIILIDEGNQFVNCVGFIGLRSHDLQPFRLGDILQMNQMNASSLNH